MSIPPSLIPQPRSVVCMDGVFLLTLEVAINAAGDAQLEADFLADRLAFLFGQKPATREFASGTRIVLALEKSERFGPEGYCLSVTQDRVRIAAQTRAGLFYCIQTLLQLIPSSAAMTSIEIPCCEIEDAPLFSWRGLMLDVRGTLCRLHFVTKFIDVMATHKLNVLHLHLTDDQGWRLQIDKFPKLAQMGAYRPESLIGHMKHNKEARVFDGCPHRGSYSKQDIQKIVAHAGNRHITVVPEIEMPGHAQAVPACYSNLSCTGGPFEVSKLWGVHNEVFCAGNEEVFSFLEAVLDETMDLFPSEFIHVGGDECPKVRWKECPKCQKRIRQEGLADEHELQSWFIRRIERYLTARGRRLIGWDEILEGGLAPGATVMSWRGEEGGIAAAQSSHDVVMASHQHTYFDYYQADPAGEPLAIGGMLPLRKVYEHRVIPAALNADEARHVLGIQGQIWTEYIPSPERVEYMTFPRACALAEVAWGTSNAEDYNGFLARLKPHLKRLDSMKIAYRRMEDESDGNGTQK